MDAPASFVSALNREFPELRIRWSFKRNAWQVEQKVGRGALPPLRIDPYDDSLIRARDGYWFVCEVQGSDRMGCPTCHRTLKVPHLQFREIRCESCIRRGKDGRVLAGFFPLGEALLEHLRRTDPLRGAIERLSKEADEANKQYMNEKARELSTYTEAAAKDAFNKIVGIPQVGFTGNNKTIHFDKDF